MKDLGLTTANQNRAWNTRANLKGAGTGAPKSTSDGKDLGPNATNSGAKAQTTPLSPSAKPQNP